MPSVSVVVPCYNAAPFVRETLDSVLAQTHAPVEVLVVDDGSTDQSAAIAEAYGEPVRVIRQTNQGESVARNRGVDEATGDWIAFLDADDLWVPSRVARCLEAAGPETVAIVNNVHFFGRETRDAPRWTEPAAVMSSLEFICDLHAFLPSTVMMRGDVDARFPEWTQHAEDYVFTLELCQRGTVAFVDEPLTHYRLHDRNQSGHPASAVRRDQTIARWLNEHAPVIGAGRVQAIRARQIEHLVAHARTARFARRWDTFDSVCAYLAAYRSEPAVVQLLGERRLPRWLYACIDAMDRLPFVHSMRTRVRR